MDPKLSERARKKILSLQNAKKNQHFLRVKVLGGGCSGFQYDFTLTDSKEEEDYCIFYENEDSNQPSSLLLTVIDATSLGFLKDAEIDHKDTLAASEFFITNPHVKAKCGCGNSFDI